MNGISHPSSKPQLDIPSQNQRMVFFRDAPTLRGGTSSEVVSVRFRGLLFDMMVESG